MDNAVSRRCLRRPRYRSSAHTTACIPWTTGSPNIVLRAAVGSTCSGLKSPARAANRFWSARENRRVPSTLLRMRWADQSLTAQPVVANDEQLSGPRELRGRPHDGPGHVVGDLLA